MSDTGERVKWSNLERVDLVDMDAVSTLQQQNQARALAALLDNFAGNEVSPPARGGLLSRLDYDGTTTTVTFGPMTLFYAANGGAGAVFRYDLSEPHHAALSTASLDFSAHTGGPRPFVWARRVPVETDEEPRRFWDELTEAEYTDNVATRVREVVELGLSPVGDDNAEPAGGASGWFRVARATSVTTAVVLSPRHVLDPYDSVYESSAANETNGAGARWYPHEPVIDTLRNPTLPELARYVIAALAKVQDGRWNFATDSSLDGAPTSGLRSWRYGLLDTAFRGLKQLQDESDAMDARADAIEDDIAAIVDDPIILYAATISWNGSAYVVADEVAVAPWATVAISDAALGAGRVAQLLMPNVSAGWTIMGAHATAFGAYPLTTTGPTVVRVACDQSLPFATDGAADFNFELAAFYKGNVGNDDWVVTNTKIYVTIFGRRT